MDLSASRNGIIRDIRSGGDSIGRLESYCCGSELHVDKCEDDIKKAYKRKVGIQSLRVAQLSEYSTGERTPSSMFSCPCGSMLTDRLVGM